MMIYRLSYYNNQTKQFRENFEVIPLRGSGEKPPQTMKEAVRILINRTNNAGVKISKISCTVKNSSGVQRFCDTCLENEACYGFKDKTMKCKVCYEKTKNST
jgi:hypothetical protein